MKELVTEVFHSVMALVLVVFFNLLLMVFVIDMSLTARAVLISMNLVLVVAFVFYLRTHFRNAMKSASDFENERCR